MPIEPPFTIAENKPPFLARLAGRIFTPSTTPAGYRLIANGDGTADWGAGGGGGTVDSVTAADTSIVVDNTDPANPTVATGTLDVIATDHPPAADWSNNSKKITGVTAGAAAGEAAIYDQTPAGIVTATGDTLYASAAHTIARLAIGATNQGLAVVGGIPAWVASATSTLSATGDLLYASGANTLARLGIGTTGQGLQVSGGLPSWQPTATSVLTAAGDILYASAANTLARLAKGSDGQVLTLASGVPSWAASGSAGAGSSSLVYRYTVSGSDKASIDTGVDSPNAGSNDWTNGDLLEIFIYSRTDEAVTVSTINMVFNNDTSAAYDAVFVRDVNATVSGNNALAATSLGFGIATGALATSASDFGYARLVFANYMGSAGFKHGELCFSTDPQTAASMAVTLSGISFRSTGALSRFAITPNTGGAKLKVGTQLLVYKRLAS